MQAGGSTRGAVSNKCIPAGLKLQDFQPNALYRLGQLGQNSLDGLTLLIVALFPAMLSIVQDLQVSGAVQESCTMSEAAACQTGRLQATCMGTMSPPSFLAWAT